MKNQALELHSPFPKSFKVCKERATERGKTEWRKQRTAAAVFFRTFGALPEVHLLHTIYHFKAQEVKNPTLQTVYELELNEEDMAFARQLHPAEGQIRILRIWNSNVRKWFCNLRTWSSTCENGFQVAKSTCEIFASHHATCETGIFVHRLF